MQPFSTLYHLHSRGNFKLLNLFRTVFPGAQAGNSQNDERHSNAAEQTLLRTQSDNPDQAAEKRPEIPTRRGPQDLHVSELGWTTTPTTYSLEEGEQIDDDDRSQTAIRNKSNEVDEEVESEEDHQRGNDGVDRRSSSDIIDQRRTAQ